MFHVPEQYRITSGSRLATGPNTGNIGAFRIPHPNCAFTGDINGPQLIVIASDNAGWEHVSVHRVNRQQVQSVPTWPDMCYIKSLFWDDEDLVMQLHPRKSQYVNCHNTTLHLWRPNDGREIPEPDKELVF